MPNSNLLTNNKKVLVYEYSLGTALLGNKYRKMSVFNAEQGPIVQLIIPMSVNNVVNMPIVMGVLRLCYIKDIGDRVFGVMLFMNVIEKTHVQEDMMNRQQLNVKKVTQAFYVINVTIDTHEMG